MKVSTIDTGYFKLDGGAMFGIVPKKLWHKLNPPDKNNMCTWAMRCLLIQQGDHNILVDTGIGTKQGERFRSHFEPRDQHLLVDSLALHNLKPEDITDVFLTHLHFDHAGGAVSYENDHLIPTFKNATYWSNQTHWNWATNPNLKEAASFLKENILPLKDADVLKYVEETEGQELWDNVFIHFVDGHTKSMMYLRIEAAPKTIIYCADLIPSSYHISLPYIMSYDVQPLKTLEEKKALLQQASDKDYILVFEHDPVHEAATIERLENGRFKVLQRGSLETLLKT